MKMKITAIVFVMTLILSGTIESFAGTLTGMGEKLVKSTSILVASVNKTTADNYSYLTLGDVSIYDSINATTYSKQANGEYVQSNPWTICYEYTRTYMGQYVSLVANVGQGIRLYAKRASTATTSHTADFASWEYH